MVSETLNRHTLHAEPKAIRATRLEARTCTSSMGVQISNVLNQTQTVRERFWRGRTWSILTLQLHLLDPNHAPAGRIASSFLIPKQHLSASRFHFEASASLLPRHFSVRHIFLTPVGRFKIWIKPQILNRMYLRGVHGHTSKNIVSFNARAGRPNPTLNKTSKQYVTTAKLHNARTFSKPFIGNRSNPNKSLICP